MILYLFDENMSQHIAQSMDKIDLALSGDRIVSTTDIEELGRSASDSSNNGICKEFKAKMCNNHK